MRNLKDYFTLTCSALLILGLSMLAQGQQEEHLVGWWTFKPGEELKDLTGNFDDIEFMGAEVHDGQLDVGTGKWAFASEYGGPEIADKTLVSWAILEDLDVQAGSILTIDRTSGKYFDAIVFGEREPHRWMAGSSGFRRTQNPAPGFEEEKTGELIQMAISYEKDGESPHISIYRNGDLIGDYTQGDFATWPTGDAEVFWGVRHVTAAPNGNLDALIEDSRIYDVVLTQDEIRALQPNTTQVEARGKLATLWGTIKAK